MDHGKVWINTRYGMSIDNKEYARIGNAVKEIRRLASFGYRLKKIYLITFKDHSSEYFIDLEVA